MSYITAGDWAAVGSKIKEYQIRLELLDDDGKVCGKLEGETIGGSLTVDAESATRRVFNPTFVVAGDSYIPGEKSNIWFNRYVDVYLRVKTPRQNDYLEYKLGRFLFSENDYRVDRDNRTLSANLVDMMETLTGTLAGQIGGAYQTVIPAETSTIREAMISTVQQLGGINKFVVCNLGTYVEDGQAQDERVPYDLEFETGSMVYDIVTELRDLYPGYETFFDVDGTFICQKVPTGIGDPVALSSNIIDNYGLVIEEDMTSAFPDIKNTTEVWGKNIETDRYTENCTLSANNYTVTIDNCESLEDGQIIGVKIDATNPSDSPTITINLVYDDVTTTFLSNQYIWNYDDVSAGLLVSTLKAGSLGGGYEYCFTYKNGKILFMGKPQVHAMTMLYSREPTSEEKQSHASKYNYDDIKYIVNPDSPFTVDKIGVRLQVLSGGEYEDIYTDDLARQRAEYENWKTTAFQDTITLEMILIPWLDANQKVSYRSQVTNQVDEYLIKTIDFNLEDGTMQVQLRKFYPLYPFSR